jgi:hypothetical protein
MAKLLNLQTLDDAQKTITVNADAIKIIIRIISLYNFFHYCLLTINDNPIYTLYAHNEHS